MSVRAWSPATRRWRQEWSLRPVAAVLALAGAWLGPVAALAEETPQAALEQLAWLAGCWQLQGGEPGTVEHWLPLAGGTLLGVSRTVRGGTTVAHEFLQIRALDDGRVGYIALPSGQAEATFVLTAVSAEAAVFENPAHDFPQRIGYRRDGPQALEARVEGRLDGVERVISLRMNRESCEQP